MACRVKIFRNFFKNVSWISSGNLLEIGQAVFVDTVNLHRKTTTHQFSHAINQGRRQVKICGVDTHGKCRARIMVVYNGGLGVEPPAGSKGRASGQGVRGGKVPLKPKTF